MTTYLLAGGGTAGHVNPLLAVADRIRDREPDATILVLGTAEGLEARLVPQRGYELLTIARLPFPRRASVAALRFPARFRAAVAQTRAYLDDRGVDVVVGFGGYAAAPAYIAAARAHLPLVIHEANAKPGMANRVGSRFTRYVGVAFNATRLRGGRVVGMPLRREIERLDRGASRAEGLRFFGLDADKPVLLVTGGSLGARKLNATVSEAIALILGSGWQVLHIAGNRSEVRDPLLPGYTLLEYCDRMDLAIAVADLAIARSGAATVSELSAVGVAAVYVPYPVGNGEQRFNAKDAVAAGAARLVADADFTPAWIARDLLPLLRDRAAIAEMAAATITVGSRDGADRMIDLINSARASHPASV
ncbi:UDP-N-acetylglucosamine-N-acetylmuramylpentapeptide N-acetylglucosamine transferase [Glaciihabitans tibetensis]|uniref:UDP-N-acetylglucosamine--N-acetylmuramyl-(pentapeptide) pyrophosphoryl-undecaprenol N-acetylglucosamine transferase n=1 Tax=Glaciihabitans tibetensis TaxID=1266600 RepID=A0A2T0VEB3_9MICO|nr:UDP-N-acetylglucosamine--N-acetylmuramyl-(pentapeptide) pyrophosphoryl-undecaprenol N-acetylglucosamine transferase [Glaciihabitans tibetensis]PRY68526.1 UDP-N-acetylglucosamine-N-acetylmuramylpentapeptide N-acetylglucosamine transferase [Glaciihabitans tibetensis]